MLPIDKITFKISLLELNDVLPSLIDDVDELNQAIEDARKDALPLVNELQKRLSKAETRLAKHQAAILSTEAELYLAKRRN